jgi:AAA domain, putative AbiEii toxin, Type IV TA system
MYRELTVSDFRGMRSLRVERLGRINIVTGRNNTGKTTLLEALFLHAGGFNPQLSLTLVALRGREMFSVQNSPAAEAPWDSLFRNYDTALRPTIEAMLDGARDRIQLRSVHDPSDLRGIPVYVDEKGPPASSPFPDAFQALELTHSRGKEAGVTKHYLVLDSRGLRMIPQPSPPTVGAFFLSPSVRDLKGEIEQYGTLVVRKAEEPVLEMMRLLEPGLKSLSISLESGSPIVYADVDGSSRLLPLHLMGQGISRLFVLATYLVKASGGVLLIDEIENGIHHSAFESLWSAIFAGARRLNVQIFATTHSFELMAAATRALPKTAGDDLRVVRLESGSQGLSARTLDSEAVSAAVSAGFEVR